MEFFKRMLQNTFTKDDSQSNHSLDDQFDNESVFYTIEHYKPDAQRASGSVFKGNVTGKSIVSGAHQRWASGFKCSPVYTKPNDNVQKISDDNAITPAITPDTYTTSNRATPNSSGDRMSPTELVVGFKEP